MDIQIRDAKETDIELITGIYAHHVLHGTASFETELLVIDEMERCRLDVVSRGLPYLVAVVGGEVIGYAYATLYRTRVAYRFTLEDSVYIHKDHMGRGVGEALLRCLIQASRDWGCRQMVAVIGDSENLGSIRVHEKLGFRHSGVLRDVGFKFDRWLDTVMMQLPL